MKETQIGFQRTLEQNWGQAQESRMGSSVWVSFQCTLFSPRKKWLCSHRKFHHDFLIYIRSPGMQRKESLAVDLSVGLEGELFSVKLFLCSQQSRISMQYITCHALVSHPIGMGFCGSHGENHCRSWATQVLESKWSSTDDKDLWRYPVQTTTWSRTILTLNHVCYGFAKPNLKTLQEWRTLASPMG